MNSNCDSIVKAILFLHPDLLTAETCMGSGDAKESAERKLFYFEA